MKEKIIIGIVVSVITLVLSFGFTSFINRENKIKESVSKAYVDEKDKEITVAFRQGDIQIKEYCVEKDEANKEVFDDKFTILLQEIRLNRSAINNNH